MNHAQALGLAHDNAALLALACLTLLSTVSGLRVLLNVLPKKAKRFTAWHLATCLQSHFRCGYRALSNALVILRLMDICGSLIASQTPCTFFWNSSLSFRDHAVHAGRLSAGETLCCRPFNVAY